MSSPVPPPLTPEQRALIEAMRDRSVIVRTFGRRIADALTAALARLDALESLSAEHARLRGAMAADDARLRAAESRVWTDGTTWGCDAPDHMAELILWLRAEHARFREALEAVEKHHVLLNGRHGRGEERSTTLAIVRAALTRTPQEDRI